MKGSMYDIYAKQIAKMITNIDEFNQLIPIVNNCIIKGGYVDYQQAKQLKKCLNDNSFIKKQRFKSLLKGDLFQRTDKSFLSISYFIMYILYHFLENEDKLHIPRNRKISRVRGGKRKKTNKYRKRKNKSIKLKK